MNQKKKIDNIKGVIEKKKNVYFAFINLFLNCYLKRR